MLILGFMFYRSSSLFEVFLFLTYLVNVMVISNKDNIFFAPDNLKKKKYVIYMKILIFKNS